MKRFIYSFSGLILAATAAHAQPAGDVGAAEAEAPSSAAEGATDTSVPADDSTLPGPADAGADPAADAGAPDAADAATTDTAASASAFSDTEVDSFAKATVKLQAIQSDTTIAEDQKQSAMAAAVTDAGLDPAKYNEIGAQVSADEALRARVQTAMARHAGNSDG
jgi:hypothetical protein